MNTSESKFPMESDKSEILVKRLMPPFILTEAEKEVACQKREHTRFFAKTYWESIVHDPSDAKISRHLECEWKYDALS